MRFIALFIRTGTKVNIVTGSFWNSNTCCFVVRVQMLLSNHDKLQLVLIGAMNTAYFKICTIILNTMIITKKNSIRKV
ncbi:hypothetical protein CYG49_03350, partial [Candidatus Saccharibacteria bacterium]